MSVAAKTGVVKLVHRHGFGFIRPDGTGEDLFFHMNQVDGAEPAQGDRVKFLPGRDHQGRPRAEQVQVIG